MLILKKKYIYYVICIIYRDVPIDQPVIGIGRFLAWPGPDRWPAGQSHVFADTEPILLLPVAQAETSQPRAHSQ